MLINCIVQHESHVAGQYSLNFLHRFLFLATQAQVFCFFFHVKELWSSQLPCGVGTGAVGVGAGAVGVGAGAVGAETGAVGVYSGMGVQKLTLSFFPMLECSSTTFMPSTFKE